MQQKKFTKKSASGPYTKGHCNGGLPLTRAHHREVVDWVLFGRIKRDDFKYTRMLQIFAVGDLVGILSQGVIKFYHSAVEKEKRMVCSKIKPWYYRNFFH